MIEYFLKNTFPRHYGIDPNMVNVPIEHIQSPFTKVDAKACNDAANIRYNKECVFNKYRDVCSICDRVVLKVDNNGHEITIVEFENYINSLPSTIIGNRCDLLMTDGITHNKIVFCDLCCYDEKYIGPNAGDHPEGKRAFARKQMENSIEMFMNVEVLNHYILTYPEKVCLFAYRTYNAIQQPVRAQRGNVENNMQAMMVTPSSVSGRIVTEANIMKHNFTFVQNKYPAVYNW